ncbi:Uncharacterized protein OBRU01_06949, partial [Operophtera brumata]
GSGAGSATLRWGALRGAHAGWYRCRASWLDAEYSSIGYYLNVIRIKDALYQEGGEYRCVGARGPDLMRLRELKRVTLKVTGGATATALSAEPAAGGWRLECGACGRGVRVVWMRARGGEGDLGVGEESSRFFIQLIIREVCIRLNDHKRNNLFSLSGATATALSAEPAAGGWRLECGACGRGVRVVWMRARGGEGDLGVGEEVLPAALRPDLAHHCWRAIWCIAASPTGGAVAVFPRRAPHPSPAPARHTVRALHNSANASLCGVEDTDRKVLQIEKRGKIL